MILRSFFDQSSIPERRMNGEWTENERRMNGEWTEDERRLNGARTELERRLNGARTELERRTIRKICRTALVRSVVFFRVTATKFIWEAFDDVNGNDFFMIVVFFRLENGSKKRSVFLRYDIGIISELSSAKMERVLANLRVQSYNTKERIPNFFANLCVSKS